MRKEPENVWEKSKSLIEPLLDKMNFLSSNWEEKRGVSFKIELKGKVFDLVYLRFDLDESKQGYFLIDGQEMSSKNGIVYLIKTYLVDLSSTEKREYKWLMEKTAYVSFRIQTFIQMKIQEETNKLFEEIFENQQLTIQKKSNDRGMRVNQLELRMKVAGVQKMGAVKFLETTNTEIAFYDLETNPRRRIEFHSLLKEEIQKAMTETNHSLKGMEFRTKYGTPIKELFANYLLTLVPDDKGIQMKKKFWPGVYFI